LPVDIGQVDIFPEHPIVFRIVLNDGARGNAAVEFGVTEVGDVCLVRQGGYVGVGGIGCAPVRDGEDEAEDSGMPAGAEDSDEDGEGDEGAEPLRRGRLGARSEGGAGAGVPELCSDEEFGGEEEKGVFEKESGVDAEVVDVKYGGADEGRDGHGDESDEEQGAMGGGKLAAFAPGWNEEDEKDDAVEAKFKGKAGSEEDEFGDRAEGGVV